MYNAIVVSIARILSTALHPVVLFLPVPYILIFHTTGNVEQAIKWTFFSWIFIFVMCIFVLYEVKSGKFTNFDISKREQRPRFFIFIGILMLIYVSCLLLLHGPLSLLIVAFGILFGLLLLDFINGYIKASIHVAAVTGILLVFVILNGIGFSWLLLFAPLVGWSRVKLHKHSPRETIIGGLFGLLLTIVVYASIEYVFRY